MMKRLLLTTTLLAFATPVYGQSIPDANAELAKAKTEIQAAKAANDRALLAIDNALKALNPPPVLCWDGSQVIPPVVCPPEPLPKLTLSTSTNPVPESKTDLYIKVTKDADNKKPLTYSWSILPETALLNSDILPNGGTRTIPAGTMTDQFVINQVNDTTYEPTETFSVKAVGPNNTTTLQLTILDDDPQPITCPDGSVVIPPATCPIIPPTPPGDVFVPVEGYGLVDIPSEFDWQKALKPYPQAPSAAPDVVGAFRFICGHAGLGRFDPIVYPGDLTGKSHLHDFYGNTGIGPNSTYETLRASGKSTCAYGDFPANRSGYWTAAMMDGRGRVILVDYVAIYYKRRPASDPVVSDPANAKYQGKAADLPNGLRFTFGFDMATGKDGDKVDYILQNPPNSGTGLPNWAVISNNGAGWQTIKEVAASGKVQPGLQLIRRIHAPSCWDGKRVDTADHRSHLSYPSYGSWGYPKCDAAHPRVIPEFQIQEIYTIATGDDLNLWHASSNEHYTDHTVDTSHADFFMAWDPTIKKLWHDNCMNKKLNCSAGDVGDARALNYGAQSMYPDANGNLVPANQNPYRSSPIPGAEANDKLIGLKF